MCGFAGFANCSSSHFHIDESLLDAMQKKIAHRGPDDARIWSSQEHQIGLAFRRLSIIDLSSAGMQPMFDREKTIAVCFNGEVYNYQTIRKELELLGYQYTSTSDTENIIYAYKAWGMKFLDKFEGMFAIALYDFTKRSLYLVRDRMGVKPLYFSLQGGILNFSSEIKALWELPWIDKKISSLALYHYLTFMVTPAPYTIYEGVYKLPAGFYLVCDEYKKISFTQWYSPLKQLSSQEKKQYYNEDFCLENINTLLFESTKKRMIGDVPVGAFLSGGIDSSLNVALMSQCVSSIKTFTVSFSDEPETNELAWARLVAKKFGTDHHEIVISEKEAFDFYEQMVYHLDEPLADCVCIPFYYVSKLARDIGIKVVQVGEGADELFFGYPLYGQYKKIYDYLWRPSDYVLPAFVKKGMSGIINPMLGHQSRLQDIVHNWSHKRHLFWGGALAFTEQQKKFLVSSDDRQDFIPDQIVSAIYSGMRQSYDSFSIIDYHMSVFKKNMPGADIGAQILYLELVQRLPELLLMRADKMSMAVGVEAREPFLDHKLVEFMLHVPVSLKYKNNTTKYLLKKVSAGLLPDAIIYRKKVGFAAPTYRWLYQGKYFPSYFKKLGRQQSVSNHFLPDAHHVTSTYCNNKYVASVQNWVLQNVWALR